MKMRTRIILTLLVAVQMSVALCEKNFFYEQFFSKHHRGHSTTEAISSSTPGYSTSEAISSSTRDISSEEELESSSSDFVVTSKQTTSVLKSPGDRHRFHHMFIARIGLVVGSIVAFLCIIAVIVCLCPKCCRGSEYRGYVRRSDIQTATEVLPEQPILVSYPVQQVIVQNITAQYPQDLPPEYQPRLPQYQTQRIIEQQFHHLPEPPPPYEFHPK